MASELIQALVYDVPPQGFVFLLGDLNYRINMSAMDVGCGVCFSIVFAADCRWSRTARRRSICRSLG